MILKWAKSRNLLSAGGKVIAVTCNVRNELNGQRTTQNPEDVVYSLPPDGSSPVPYMPRTFPIGKWRITGIKAKSSAYLAPFFISTDAWQMVPEWTLELDGTYGEPTGCTVKDAGYGLHFSSSSTTLGCGKIILKEDLIWLVEMIKGCGNEVVFLEVSE